MPYYPEDQSELRNLYWEQGLSIAQIARLKHSDVAAIHKYMVRFGVPRRSLSESISKSKLGELNPMWGGNNVNINTGRDKMTYEISKSTALPDEQQLRHDLQAINKFQQIVHANMISGSDYGVIPGTQKPTLLKPGAEKIAKLLGLADHYEILDRQEDWDKPFFRYLVKCSLESIATGTVISEGLGECNSMESKYRWRWVFPDDVPESIDKQKLTRRTGKRRDGKGTYTQYRLENEDIYSQVNTILKMAKKRALVDAALSAGRLSEVFTQDIEDMTDAKITETKEKTPKAEPAIAVASNSPEESVVESSPGQSEETKETIPQTMQALYNWVSGHGKQYTRTWVLEVVGMTEEEIKQDFSEGGAKAYYTLKKLQQDW